MRKILGGTGIALLLLALVPMQAMAQNPGEYMPTGTRIGESVNGPRPPQPIAREKFENAVTKMFRAADTNRDGMITLDEFNAVISARKSAAIRERFAQVDSNNDQSLSLAEFNAWQMGLGAAVLSTAPNAGLNTFVAEQISVDLGQSYEDESLTRLIKPIGAVVLVEANTDYDASVSLAELLAYEGAIFDAADRNHDNWLAYEEVQLLSPLPGGGVSREDPSGRPSVPPKGQ